MFLVPPCERRRRKLPRESEGMPPQEIFWIEHSEMLFLVFLEPKNQFPRQGWSSLKFSLKSNILMTVGREGEMATTEFSVVYHGEFIFYWFSKKT